MSQRTKKTTTTTTTSRSGASAVGMSTPVSSTSGGGAGDSLRSPRSVSPTVISRLQEKNDLASLNDRLASYIDRVRQLEGENTRLSRIVQTQEDTVSREVTGIKGMYEGELASARRLLDDTSKEKAKLQIEVGKLKTELEELREKLRVSEKDLAASDKKLMSAESQVNDLQAKLNDAVNQRRHYEDEYNKLKKDFDALSKSLAVAKRQLEEETIARVDLENRLQSLKEELAFKAQIHEQELNESVHRSRVVVEAEEMRTDYANQLGDALRQVREENDAQIRQMREESDSMLERKLAQLREMAARPDGLSDKEKTELKNARSQIDSLSSQLSTLRSQNASYEARIRDLENQLKHDAAAHEASLDALNAEIKRLRSTLDSQLAEYRDLMDVKIQLDTEIAAYRKLLESEETRLNISDMGSPGRTPAATDSRKRKRAMDEVDTGLKSGGKLIKDSTFSADFTTKSSSKDVIEVFETSVDGTFIKLFNSSKDKDVPLAGWQLQHSADSEESVFKFPRGFVLKAQQYVTVWSSTSHQTHSPPTDLVMKGIIFYSGTDMKTVLKDQKGEEMASREMKKSQLRTTTTSSSASFVHSSVDSGTQESSQGKSKSKWGWSLFSSLINN